jgi:hypothetical protein
MDVSNNAEQHVRRIRALLRAGKAQAVLTGIEALPEAYKETHEILRIRALAEWGTGDTDASFRTFEHLVERGDRSVGTLYLGVERAVELSRFEEAVGWLGGVLEFERLSGDDYYIGCCLLLRAHVNIERRQLDLARLDLKREAQTANESDIF